MGERRSYVERPAFPPGTDLEPGLSPSPHPRRLVPGGWGPLAGRIAGALGRSRNGAGGGPAAVPEVGAPGGGAWS